MRGWLSRTVFSGGHSYRIVRKEGRTKGEADLCGVMTEAFWEVLREF